MKEFIEIPFGAKDSELGGWEYNIPEGMEATIVDNKIVVKKKDSEDEKIRKGIIRCVKCNMPDNDFRKKYLAWLEKQGEQKAIDYNKELKKCRENPLYFFDKYVKVKLKEQTPSWGEEDENVIKVLMNIIKKSEIIDHLIYTDLLKEKLYDWLKSIKDRVQSQPNKEWSE